MKKYKVNKYEVRENIKGTPNVTLDMLEGPVHEVLQKLTKIVADIEGHWWDVIFQEDYCYEYSELDIVGTRHMTPFEKEKQVKKDFRAKQKKIADAEEKIAREQKELHRLKTKYEGFNG